MYFTHSSSSLEESFMTNEAMERFTPEVSTQFPVTETGSWPRFRNWLSKIAHCKISWHPTFKVDQNIIRAARLEYRPLH